MDIALGQQSLSVIKQTVETNESVCLIDQTASAKNRSAATKADLKKKLGQLRADLKAITKRMDSAVPIAKQMIESKALDRELETLQGSADALSGFVAVLQSQEPLPEDFSEAVKRCESYGVEWSGAEMHKYEFWMRSQHFLSHQHHRRTTHSNPNRCPSPHTSQTAVRLKHKR